MTANIKVNKRGVGRVKARNLWIYRSDVVDTSSASAGDVVRVTGPRGELLGSALYSSKFDDRGINRDFWLSRLRSAETFRNRVMPGQDAYRLVHSESDLLPSLVIDRYGDCFSIQTLSQGMDRLKQMWADLLVELYSPRAVIERNEARVRALEGLPRTAGPIYGADPGEIEISEDGVKFLVDLVKGQKTGFFLDQKENRVAAGRYSVGRALDCFTFQGGFALHMAKGAESVTAVDSSAPALEQARRNAQANGIGNVDFVEGNVFDVLAEMDRSGERFDTIVLDPPAFAKSADSVDAAYRGYKEINLRAMKTLNPEGTLITSTCSYHVGEEAFLNILAEAASDAGRSLALIEKRTQSRDHPILLSMPETYYLKCMILRAQV
jgi:23S rRNA (cytosine1962-C5)-methyltransferase